MLYCCHMSDKAIRHLISALAFLAAVAVYAVGYFSGVNGWWWTMVTLIVIYAIVYKLVEA